jgi:BRCT domain type II-containing protein
MPKPGQNGAIAGVFDGQTMVLTGLFPEVGGGTGLNLGKEKMKSLIENFGGRVTGSVSGKTDFLVVGKDPGASKVSKASAKSIPLVDLLALNRVM